MLKTTNEVNFMIKGYDVICIVLISNFIINVFLLPSPIKFLAGKITKMVDYQGI